MMNNSGILHFLHHSLHELLLFCFCGDLNEFFALDWLMGQAPEQKLQTGSRRLQREGKDRHRDHWFDGDIG